MHVRHATEDDLPAIKRIAGQYSKELGYVMYPALRESILRGSLLVYAFPDGLIAGFVNYRLRKDGGVTVYEIATHKLYTFLNIGRHLIEALPNTQIRLKCTVDNPANGFYEHIGFTHVATEQGRKRLLNIWIKEVSNE